MEGSWEGIAGCVVHVDVHGECVCCGWMQCSCSRRDVLGWLLFMVMKYPLFQLNALLEKKLTFQLPFCSLHQSIHIMHKHCCVCSDEDCRIAVEMSAFSNKAFGWNKGYFVTNVVAVEHGRYSLSCMQKL